jgi:hypothetical protein
VKVTELFAVVAVCVAAIGIIGIGAYLVVHDHPWFGLLVILMASGIRLKTGDAAKEAK